MMIKDMNADCM